MEEKRIYAIVAEKVETPLRGIVKQIPGRMSAQLQHVGSRMRMHVMVDRIKTMRRFKPEHLRAIADEAITTIQLVCRDTKELDHVANLLLKAHIQYYGFKDTNLAVYGEGEIRTAIATVPVEPYKVEGITDYLPLFLSNFPQEAL